MNQRLILYFFGVFFTSMAGGFSDVMTGSAWAKLVICSLGSASMAAFAYIDRGPGGRPPDLRRHLSKGTTMGAIVVISLVLAGCSTRVIGPDGRAQLVTYANAGSLTFRGPGTYLQIRDLDHSTPTKEAATGVMSVTTAAGAAAAGLR